MFREVIRPLLRCNCLELQLRGRKCVLNCGVSLVLKKCRRRRWFRNPFVFRVLLVLAPFSVFELKDGAMFCYVVGLSAKMELDLIFRLKP